MQWCTQEFYKGGATKIFLSTFFLVGAHFMLCGRVFSNFYLDQRLDRGKQRGCLTAKTPPPSGVCAWLLATCTYDIFISFPFTLVFRNHTYDPFFSLIFSFFTQHQVHMQLLTTTPAATRTVHQGRSSGCCDPVLASPLNSNDRSMFSLPSVSSTVSKSGQVGGRVLAPDGRRVLLAVLPLRQRISHGQRETGMTQQCCCTLRDQTVWLSKSDTTSPVTGTTQGTSPKGRQRQWTAVIL